MEMGAEAGVEADVEVLGGKDESSRLGCWLMGGGIEYVGWSLGREGWKAGNIVLRSVIYAFVWGCSCGRIDAGTWNEKLRLCGGWMYRMSSSKQTSCDV